MNREGQEAVIDTLFRSWRQSLEEILKAVPTPEANEADWIKAAAYSSAAQRPRLIVNPPVAGYGSMEQQTIARLQVENEQQRCVTRLQGGTIESMQKQIVDLRNKLLVRAAYVADLERRADDVYRKNQAVSEENKQLQTTVQTYRAAHDAVNAENMRLRAALGVAQNERLDHERETLQLASTVNVADEKIRELEQRLRQVIPSKDAQEAIVAGLLALVSSQFCSSQVLSERKNEIEDYMHAAFVAHHWADKASA